MSQNKNGVITSFISTKKTIASAGMIIFCGGYGVYFLTISEYLGGLVFLVIAAIFARMLYVNGCRISVSHEGIRRTLLGKSMQLTTWDQIQEMGLIGENVFSRKDKKTGDKYIYFSPYKMTADERFQMIVKWPPKKEIVYVEYSPEMLERAQFLYKGQIQTYNVRDLFDDTEIPTGDRQKPKDWE